MKTCLIWKIPTIVFVYSSTASRCSPHKLGLYIHGVPVLGSGNDLARLVERYQPDEVLVAMDETLLRSQNGKIYRLQSGWVPLAELVRHGKKNFERLATAGDARAATSPLPARLSRCCTASLN